jgi:hypothetical protein
MKRGRIRSTHLRKIGQLMLETVFGKLEGNAQNLCGELR